MRHLPIYSVASIENKTFFFNNKKIKFFPHVQEDLASLCRNATFLLSTLAFTCVTFCTGALSWWGPVYIEKALLTLPPSLRMVEPSRYVP